MMTYVGEAIVLIVVEPFLLEGEVPLVPKELGPMQNMALLEENGYT
jgi:hypothetical protein